MKMTTEEADRILQERKEKRIQETNKLIDANEKKMKRESSDHNWSRAGIISSFILGIASIILGILALNNSAQLKALKLLADRQAGMNEKMLDFINKQSTTNSRLLTLVNGQKEQNDKTNELLALNLFIAQIQGQSIYPELKRDTDQFLKSWRAINDIFDTAYAHIKPLSPLPSHFEMINTTYSLRDIFLKEQNNSTLMVQGIKSEWLQCINILNEVYNVNEQMRSELENEKDEGKRREIISQASLGLQPGWENILNRLRYFIKSNSLNLKRVNYYLEIFNKENGYIKGKK